VFNYPTMSPSSLLFEDDQERQDDELIKQLIENPDSLEIPLEASSADLGPKHADAIDFEDISDNELPEEEEERAVNGTFDKKNDDLDLQNLTGMEIDGLDDAQYPQDELDDLFGEASSPVEDAGKQNKNTGMSFDFEGDEVLGQPIGPIQDASSPLLSNEGDSFRKPRDLSQDLLDSLGEAQGKELLLQRKLFEGVHDNTDASEEALASMWPTFKKDVVPRFLELFPFKKARWVGKAPAKPPKPVQPTKLKLEIAFDQEKHFKLSTGPQKRKFDSIEDNGFIRIIGTEANEHSDEDDTETEDENEVVGGVSWQELQTICADWDILSPTSENSDFDLLGNDNQTFSSKSSKRQKLSDITSDIQYILNAPRFESLRYDNFEKLLAKTAKKVILPLEDPHLLLVEQDLENTPKKPKTLGSFKDGRTFSTKEMLNRYNISNDAAYDKLKQNHQNKIRSTLGNLSLAHSMPAQRLQWPYYKTNLSKTERRSFHRPVSRFTRGEPITFQIPRHLKKKNLRGKDTAAVFNKTIDISLSDNSHALLLEYSEEAPITMSNFGMSSRLINYYRKRHADDAERPKMDIGELSVLMPNDTSPLTQFGEIKPGELRPAIYNSMFKAPVYQHQPKPTDFLMIRNSTGLGGANWFIREIDYLSVVGQQFPTIEVPPPGGRKVTTVSKNRLKMISYRLMKRRKPQRVPISLVTEHVADSSDMQNRQKMKDFLTFNKEHREWEMQGGAPVPDEDVVRTYVSPEDVCLLESMQVGEQHLLDEGIGNEYSEAQNEDEDAKEGLSTEQQLAPWALTKNFLNAAANKAMLQLHGEGDPSGRGEAFSFLKVSMKGGFRAPFQSAEDHIDAKKRAENGGHNYNVQKQAEQYRETIHHVWDAQNESLSSKIEHSDPEPDPDDEPEQSRRSVSRFDLQPSGLLRRRDDETMSHLSKYSTDSQSGKICRIVRKVLNASGELVEQEEIVEDPRVWKKYIAIKNKQKSDSIE
jgi:transcription initiation factor TFIID subunit 1, fungi type